MGGWRKEESFSDYTVLYGKTLLGHSSVDSSVPSIMLPQVRLPSTPSMLLSFIVRFVLYLSLCCEKEQK